MLPGQIKLNPRYPKYRCAYVKVEVMKGRGLNRRIPVTISFEVDTLLKLDEILEKTKTTRSELVNFLVKTALSTFQPEKGAASIV
jgi:hypothetical protein